MTKPNNTFYGKPIRAAYNAERKEWLFSVVDVCGGLAESGNPRHYWTVLKRRLIDEGNQTVTNCERLKLPAADGKIRETDVLNKGGIIEIAKRIKNSAHTEALIEWLSSFDGTSRKYILKHKDIDVIEVELDDGGSIATLGTIFNATQLPIGTVVDKGVDVRELKDWWSGRSIPASREGLRELLQSVGLYLPQQLLDKSFGLSLSDQYWICPKGEALKWSNINFFHNVFSDDVGDLLFGRTGIKDKNAVSLFSPDNTSDGVLKKKWKIIGGKRCLIKGGTLPNNQEVANEVLAARICKRLGIPFVDYFVLEIDGVKYSVCEDFITGDTELMPAWRIKSLFKKDNNTSDYDAFIAEVEKFGISDARLRIDMMLTLDFIIANTDRHYNNFGVVRDANTLKWISVAPIYDSGTSMWCKEPLGAMNAESLQIESKPFRSRHDKQIKLVKDFSWLNLDALDGIENEYAEILESVSDPLGLELRNKKLCMTLRKRIELLRNIVGGKL